MQLVLAAMFLSSCVWKTSEDGDPTFLGTYSRIAPPLNEEAFSGVHSQTVICGYFPLSVTTEMSLHHLCSCPSGCCR